MLDRGTHLDPGLTNLILNPKARLTLWWCKTDKDCWIAHGKFSILCILAGYPKLLCSTDSLSGET